METKFMDLIQFNRQTSGNMTIDVKGSAELQAIQDLMRQTGATTSKEAHELMGAGIREPIRLLARYKEWALYFFQDWPVGIGEDNRIPLDQPIGSAFISSPEGRALLITPGVQQWVRPSFFEIKAGLRLYWRTLQTAGWPILQRRLEEAADDMSRKRDNAGKAVLDAAITTVAGHTITSTGGKLNKSAVDASVAAAAQIGFPITQMAINPSRLTDMAGWTNGSSSAIPFFFAPESKREEVYKKLYADGYAGLRYVLSHNLDINTVYLSGDPADVGYHQTYGTPQSASDVDIEDGVDLHVVREDNAFYCGNPYNLWKITITA